MSKTLHEFWILYPDSTKRVQTQVTFSPEQEGPATSAVLSCELDSYPPPIPLLPPFLHSSTFASSTNTPTSIFLQTTQYTPSIHSPNPQSDQQFDSSPHPPMTLANGPPIVPQVLLFHNSPIILFPFRRLLDSFRSQNPVPARHID